MRKIAKIICFMYVEIDLDHVFVWEETKSSTFWNFGLTRLALSKIGCYWRIVKGAFVTRRLLKSFEMCTVFCPYPRQRFPSLVCPFVWSGWSSTDDKLEDRLRLEEARRSRWLDLRPTEKSSWCQWPRPLRISSENVWWCNCTGIPGEDTEDKMQKKKKKI